MTKRKKTGLEKDKMEAKEHTLGVIQRVQSVLHSGQLPFKVMVPKLWHQGPVL